MGGCRERDELYIISIKDGATIANLYLVITDRESDIICKFFKAKYIATLHNNFMFEQWVIHEQSVRRDFGNYFYIYRILVM